jgi:hypothetical protein
MLFSMILYICKSLAEEHTPKVENRGDSVKTRIVRRSPLAVIYRLGEIARRELKMECNARTEDKCVKSPLLPPPQDPPESDLSAKRKSGQWLFFLSDGQTDNSPPGCEDFASPRYKDYTPISVTYDHNVYSVRPDPTGCDHSSEVLELVLELMALSSSARDLPSPNLITVGH